MPPRDSKKNKPTPIIRGILAANVTLLRNRVYRDSATITARNRKLAEAIGSTLSQVQRICAGTAGTSVDTLEWLAAALHVRPHDLVTPYFAQNLEPLDGEHHALPSPTRELVRRRAHALSLVVVHILTALTAGELIRDYLGADYDITTTDAPPSPPAIG